MEFTSDKMIQYLQERLDTFETCRDEGLSEYANELAKEYTACVRMVETITNRAIDITEDGKVTWAK